MFALGVCNLFGAFFSCFPVSGTLARTAVQEESGGKTQFVTVVSNFVILMVMFYIAPLLQLLPKVCLNSLFYYWKYIFNENTTIDVKKACLSAIIISALVNLIKKISDAKYYWNLDKIDFVS